ncbi:MAG: hypothetical protein HUJ26_22755 [Planctomycetaceae bacterium]|nr:hypothetical protein [Planctomycetaceae bacterium]
MSDENSGKPAGSQTESIDEESPVLKSEVPETIGGSLAGESPTEGLSTNSTSNLLELIQPDGIFNSRSPESNDFDLKPLVASNDDPKRPAENMTTIPLAPSNSNSESDADSAEETEQTAPPLPEETEPSTSRIVQDKSSPVILWPMGTSEPQNYNTLEAACANARSGSIIELRYNGFLANGHEKPITINKSITIRAAKGYQPVISFASRSNPDESDTNMITVREGTLNLVNIALHFQIEHSLTYPARDHWTLISVQGTEKVSLRNVTATIENPDREPACLMEFSRGLVTKMPDMDRINSSSTNAELDPYVVSVRDSMLRGECDGMTVKSSQPGQIRIENSVLAVEGSMFVGQGSTNMPKEDHQLGLTINHSTIFTGTTTFQFDTGEVRRLLLPVSISTENSIYAVVPEFVAPLVSMRGATNPADLRSLLSWYGDRNYYHGYQIFWTITDHLGSSELSDLEFSGWQSYWNQGDKTFEENAVSGLIDWTENGNIENPKFSQLTPEDLQIQTDSDNQQDFLASDGSVLGAAVQTLPTPPLAPLSPFD